MSKRDIHLGQQVFVIGELKIASIFKKCSLCLNHKTIIDRAGIEVKCPVCDGVGKKEVRSLKEYIAMPTTVTAKSNLYYLKKSSAQRMRNQYWIEMPVGSCSVGNRPGWYYRENFFVSKDLAERYAQQKSSLSRNSVTDTECVEPHHPDYIAQRLYYLLSSHELSDRKAGMQE